MILGFHYHVSFSRDKGSYYLPAHFGIFIIELARNVEKIVLFLHEDMNFVHTFYDLKIDKSNIQIVRLSSTLPAYNRFFNGRKLISAVKDELNKCTHLLLRGPSPLNHLFKLYFPKSKITNLMVGDYKAGNKFIHQPFYRRYAVKGLNYLMHNAYIRSIQNTKIVFNSEVLYENYAYLSKKSLIVNTTNIYQKDIKWEDRESLTNKPILKLLYVGRLEWAKGLNELIEVLKALNEDDKRPVELHIVGWDESENQVILKSFEQKIKDNNLSNHYFFHGKKKPGVELYAFYKMADFFLLPSYQEGFPRTIWEAFANCLPVIVTPVGAIPFKLIDRKHALFCKVKDAQSIKLQIVELIKNNQLHQQIVKNGYELVQKNTIEFQTKRLIDFIKSE